MHFMCKASHSRDVYTFSVYLYDCAYLEHSNAVASCLNMSDCLNSKSDKVCVFACLSVCTVCMFLQHCVCRHVSMVDPAQGQTIVPVPSAGWDTTAR